MSDDAKTGTEPEAEKAKGSKEELLALLAEFDTAMLVGIEPDGTLRARPMGLQHDKLADCDLWFVSADDTHKTDEIDRCHQVNVCCLRTRDRAYVSISARARVDRNAAEVRRLWQPSWKLWFGDEQPEDGGIVLIKLDVERAEYWEPEGGRLRVLYAMAKGFINDEAVEAGLNPAKEVDESND
ncbi:MAG: pyridoxamine 5'-phosphate oxidase family protein [Polyangia bacterium]